MPDTWVYGSAGGDGHFWGRDVLPTGIESYGAAVFGCEIDHGLLIGEHFRRAFGAGAPATEDIAITRVGVG